MTSCDSMNADPALAAGNEMLISLLDSMKTLVYVVDMHTHEIVFVNKYAESSLNKQIKVGGICWEEFECGQMEPCGFCHNRKLVGESGQSTGVHVWEYRNVANHRWYHVQDHTIRWIDGRMVRMEIATDMTAMKEAELALRESETRFRTIADVAPVIIWVADANSTGGYQGCSFFNKGWQSFTGSTDTSDDGLHWLSHVHPNDRNTCLVGYLSAFMEKRPFVIEYRLLRHDGEYRWVKDNGVPRFGDDNRLIGFVGTCLDITDQKELEACRLQRREDVCHATRMSVAGEMASGLAHELSQPLAAANNYLQGCMGLIESGRHDMAQLGEGIRSAHIQTERAGKIIAHLRDYIRKGKNDRQWVNINRLALESIQFLDHEIQRHRIHVSFDFSDLRPIYANPIDLEQVLINLLKNAIEAMQTAPIRELGIKTRLLALASEVEVSDTGKGIPESALDRVFNSFTSSKADGLGLGLTICRRIVESYGGQIRASSSPDSGSIFSFTLPLLNHA